MDQIGALQLVLEIQERSAIDEDSGDEESAPLLQQRQVLRLA